MNISNSLPNIVPSIAKIYWSKYLNDSLSKSGYIIGWNNRSFSVCILTIISSISVHKIESLLSSLSLDVQYKDLFKYCSMPPRILGRFNSTKIENMTLEEHRKITNMKRNVPLWITLTTSKNSNSNINEDIPVLVDIYCYGYRYYTSAIFILYNSPKPRYYYSSIPFQYYTPKLLESDTIVTPSDYNLSARSNTANLNNKRQSLISNNVDEILTTDSNTKQIADIDIAIRQINTTPYIVDIINKAIIDIKSLSGSEKLSSHSYAEIVKRNRSQSMSNTASPQVFSFSSIVQNMCLFPIHLFLTFIYLFFIIIYSLLEINLPFSFGILMSNSYQLKDKSVFLQQLYYKIKLSLLSPSLYLAAIQKHSYGYARSVSLYIFRNSIIKLVVDFLFGVITALIIYFSLPKFISFVHYVGSLLHLDVLKGLTIWIMTQPAGFKLNIPLVTFIGDLVLQGIDFWNHVNTFVVPFEHRIVVIFCICSIFMGAYLTLSLLLDCLSLITIHIELAHRISALVYRFFISILATLSRLFRGNKRNILRDRIDSAEFDIDQLLLGTILFTTFSFLFPTILMYYLFFNVVRLLVNAVQVIIIFAIAFLKYFPFYGLFVRFYDPEKIPGGIRLDIYSKVSGIVCQEDEEILSSRSNKDVKDGDSLNIVASHSNSSANMFKNPNLLGNYRPYSLHSQCQTSYLSLISCPLEFRYLFSELFDVLERVFCNYKPNKVIKRLMYGSQFPLLPSISSHLETINNLKIFSVFEFYEFIVSIIKI